MVVIGAASQLSRSTFVLDSGIIMRHLRGDSRAQDLIVHLEGLGKVIVSVITVTEVIAGCRNRQEVSESLRLFRRLIPTKIGLRVAQKAGYLIKQYPNVFGRGISRGVADALIAASAWQLKAKLYTLNTRHFANFNLAEISTVAIDQESSNWIPYTH